MGCGAVVRERAAGLYRAGRRDIEGTGVRCFYDGDEVVELWGKDLAEELYRFKTNRMASDLGARKIS